MLFGFPYFHLLDQRCPLRRRQQFDAPTHHVQGRSRIEGVTAKLHVFLEKLIWRYHRNKPFPITSYFYSETGMIFGQYGAAEKFVKFWLQILGDFRSIADCSSHARVLFCRAGVPKPRGAALQFRIVLVFLYRVATVHSSTRRRLLR